MGGYGSGYHGPRKRTVEECRSLDVKDLRRLGFLTPNAWRAGTLTWTNACGEQIGSLGCEVRLQDGEQWVRLHYTLNQTTAMDYRVRLDATRPRFGGTRWWFLCPSCGRRFRRLHLAPGYESFACRVCLNLTYESVRTHDGRLGFFLKHPEAALAAFQGGDVSKQFLALRAVLGRR